MLYTPQQQGPLLQHSPFHNVLSGTLYLSLSLSEEEEEEEDMKIKGTLVDVDMQWWALVLLGSPLLGTY